MVLTTAEKKEIVKRHLSGQTVRFIADVMKINPKTSFRWIKRYKETHGVNRKPRSK